MASVDKSSRRRTTDLPLKPETGLAEWTSKIKALQRQVDQDEEDETRRLEQEIAASRLARLRRSTGGASRNSSLDLSKGDIASSLRDIDSNHSILEAKTSTDRLRNQDDALRKLSGDSPKESHNNTHSGPVTMEKREVPKAPISLAAFIGGRATGPRLTKHAPQQDAHDPTQFNQRTHITAPHPVFGRGGVAMPGMAKQTNSPVSDGSNTFTNKNNSAPERDRKSSTPPVVKAFVQRVEEHRNIVSQPTGGSSYGGRQRTISTPTDVYPQRSPRTDTFEPSSATTPSQGRKTPAIAETSRSASRSPFPRTSPAPIHTPPPTTPMSTSPKSAVTTPSLARPIQPQPRKSVGAVDLSPTQTASPAFLKPPPSKDPTPSISRLQGRGFVQSMVRVSSQLEAASTPSPGRGEKPEPARKPTVLDRWQFDNGKTQGFSSPPIISPKPVAMRKSHTTDVSFPTGPSPQPASPPIAKIIKPDYTGRSLKSATSTPSMSHAYKAGKAQSDVVAETHPRLQGQNLGSGNTMISYIKPVKTGDQPTTASPSRPASRQSRPPSRPPSAAAHSRKASPEPEVDELGMRVRTRARSIGADRKGGPVREPLVEPHGTGGSGQPLSHPTKDRARKPRKARESTKTVIQQKAPLERPVSGVNGEKTRSIEHAVSAPVKPQFPSQATGIHDEGTFGTSAVGAKKPFIPPVSAAVAPESSRDEQNILLSLEISKPTTSKVASISPPSIRPVSVPPGERSPITPVRHGRIPSTGNRATVMDVAFALSEHEAQSRKSITDTVNQPAIHTELEPKIESPTAVTQEGNEEDDYVKPDVKSLVVNWGPRNGSGAPTPSEKRKSSYEKYSAFVLPPLTEEKTPIHSPAGTLRSKSIVLPAQEVLVEVPSSSDPLIVTLPGEQDGSDRGLKDPQQSQEPPVESNVIVIEHADETLPAFDVKHLLAPSDDVYRPDPDVNSISVEVMNIVGSSASVVNEDSNVFYESESLVVIHRFKTKSSGLVGTKVWSWNGSKASFGDREERKAQELARRYNTTRVAVSQYAEPAELVHVLGGRLAIRQGTRAHWSPENTAMHVVRLLHGVIYIDEVDLSAKNLCSGFAYCVSLLGTVYVWYGRGSTQEERLAATEYARGIAVSPENIVELTEGKNDEDEMFWMILGNCDYAQADYWQWRRMSPVRSPRIWKIDQHRPFAHDISSWMSLRDHVYVVDNVWEYFIVIGCNARSNRLEIKLALQIASELARRTASSKPFPSPVHALVFPTQIPTDLRVALRGVDELSLNQGELPDHMNLINVERAIELLHRTTWEKTLLQDPHFLPIGLTPTDTQYH